MENQIQNQIEFKENSKILINHFLLRGNVEATVTKVEGKIVTIFIENRLALSSLFDPIVIKYYENDTAKICAGEIIEKLDQDSLKVKINQISTLAERRQFPRYDVSLNGSVINGVKTGYITIRDISKKGLCICSSELLQKENLCQVNILISTLTTLNLMGRIIWSKEKMAGDFKQYEYGIELDIEKNDKKNLTIYDYVLKIAQEREIPV